MTSEQILKLISDTFVAITNYGKKQNDRTIQRNLQELIKGIDINNPGFVCENQNSGKGPIFLLELEQTEKTASMRVPSITDTLARMYVLEFIRYRGSAACKHSLFNMTYKMSSKQLRENNGLDGLIEELKSIPSSVLGGFTSKFKSILPLSVQAVTDGDFVKNAITLAKIYKMNNVKMPNATAISASIQKWKQKLLGLKQLGATDSD